VADAAPLRPDSGDFGRAVFFSGDVLIELRALPSKKRAFVAANDIASVRKFSKRAENIYFGVATRASADNGTAENLGELAALFADIDFKDTSEPEARALLAAGPLPPPTAIVNSGGGLHPYWSLDRPIDLTTAEARARVKELLRGIASLIGGDLAAAEPARVLRLPGSLNRKYDPPRPVVLEQLDSTRRYSLADIQQLVTTNTPKVPAVPTNTVTASAKIGTGKRNAHLTSLAGSMRRRGMSEAAITVALTTENAANCDPPLDDAEVQQIAKSISKKEPAAAPADSSGDLEFFTLAEIAARMAERGPRRYVVRGIVAVGDYGVMSAPMKAQKIMNAIDMGVSVASGTKFLNSISIDTAGSVLMFAGEGGEGGMLRRARGTAAERNLNADDLPIVICARAPHLNDAGHLAAMEAKIAALKPVLVIVDPLYQGRPQREGQPTSTRWARCWNPFSTSASAMPRPCSW
jgi:hypothetical protein